jgi:PEP-CTERM motif
MRTVISVGASVLALCSVSCASALAAPITWTLVDVTSSDGGSFTGSFVFDADTDVYSSVLITHVPDVVEPSALTFSTLNPSTDLVLNLLNGPPDPDGNIGRHSLTLDFAAPLTDAGGDINVTGLATYFTGIRSQTIDSGTVDAVGVTVPEPSTWAMMLLGFAGLGFAGWRGRRKTAGAAA